MTNKLYFGFFVNEDALGASCGWTENKYDNPADALLAMYNQGNADPYTNILGVIAFNPETETLELFTADAIEKDQPINQCCGCDL